MRILNATVFATLLLATLLSGSGARAETTITYQFWGSPQEVEAWNSVARSFEAEHPGIKVNVEASDWDSYWEKLKVKMAGGTPPDVFAMDAPLYRDWQSRGVLLNLSPYIAKTPGLFDGVYPITLEAYETEDGYYGLPRDFQTIVLYYNKDMFDAAKVAYPNDSWTWDDLRKTAAKLTLDKNSDGKIDQWGFWAEAYDMEPLWGALVWSFGGEVLDAPGGKTLIGSEKATAAFQFLSDMWLTDKSMPSAEQLKQYGTDGFFAGISAMGVSGHWVVPDYAPQKFKWDVAPMPKGPAGRATSVNSAGFVIAKDSKHPDEAWEFVKYAFGDKGQAELAKIGLAIPVRESVAKSPAYLDQATKIDHALFVHALDYAHMKPVFKGYDEWSSAVGDALNMIWSGEMSVAAGLAEAVANGDEALAKNH
jgi:multiple sugar transport system substrate-binding protein